MWSPFRELSRMQREMEDIFGRFPPVWTEGDRGWIPTVDVVDQKDGIVVRADLPGLDDKDVEVTVQNGMLTIRGERKEEREENYDYAERAGGAFLRSLPLPAGVEADQVKATFRKGVLEIHLPKAREAKGQKIEIKAE